MKSALDKIFDSVVQNISEHVESHNKGETVASNALKGAGSLPFSGHLDGNGNFNFSCSKYGTGVTISFSAAIAEPAGTYTLHISSSDGGDYHFSNVHANQPIEGKLRTSFWHSSKISISIHSDTVKDTNVIGKVNYSY